MMLANADLSEQPITFGLTSGSFADFNAAWYRLIGNAIVSAMSIGAIVPLIEFGVFWLMRWWDRY